MSTVPEVIAARAREMKCLGFSIVTNPASGLAPAPLAHDDVLAATQRVAAELSRVLRGVLRRLPR
jgi:purine nucleoside phosphorylase